MKKLIIIATILLISAIHSLCSAELTKEEGERLVEVGKAERNSTKRNLDSLYHLGN